MIPDGIEIATEWIICVQFELETKNSLHIIYRFYSVDIFFIMKHNNEHEFTFRHMTSFILFRRVGNQKSWTS